MADRKKEVVIKLAEPIEHGSEVITEMVVKRPKGRHLRSLPADPSTGDMLDFAVRLAGYPPSVADDLDIDDVAQLIEAVADFLPSSLVTGGN